MYFVFVKTFLSRPVIRSVQMWWIEVGTLLHIKAGLVICGLFICEFAYLQLEIGRFSGTYPPIYSHSWTFYMQIRYMRAKFFGPFLSHITRSNCTSPLRRLSKLTIYLSINSFSTLSGSFASPKTRVSNELPAWSVYAIHAPLANWEYCAYLKFVNMLIFIYVNKMYYI